MKINSIKTKLLILVFISIFLSFAILGFYNAQNNYGAQYNLIKQKELNLAKETSKFIDSYLKSKIDIVNAVAQKLPQTNLTVNNKKIVEKLLLGKKAGNFVDLYIGFEKDGDFLLSDGTFLNKEKDNFDARARPWYKKAVEIDKAGVSNPYVDITTKKLVVTVFTPLKHDGKLVGVVGSDIFLDTVVDTILNVKIDNMGFAYLLDSTGKTIIHKDKKQLDKENKIYKQIKTNKKLHFSEALDNGVEKLISYSNIPVTNWKLMIQLDKETIFTDINNNVIKEVILYAALLAIILGIIYFALVKILSPINTVESGLSFFFRYLKGEESNISKLNINTNDEFGNMASMIDKEMEDRKSVV